MWSRFHFKMNLLSNHYCSKPRLLSNSKSIVINAHPIPVVDLKVLINATSILIQFVAWWTIILIGAQVNFTHVSPHSAPMFCHGSTDLASIVTIARFDLALHQVIHREVFKV